MSTRHIKTVNLYTINKGNSSYTLWGMTPLYYPWVSGKWISRMDHTQQLGMTGTQNAIMPSHILSVGIMSKLSVILPWIWKVSNCTQLVPDPSGQTQDSIQQNVIIHMWQGWNATRWLLVAAFLLFHRRHLSASLADAPCWLTWDRRCCWCRSQLVDDIKRQARVPCQT